MTNPLKKGIWYETGVYAVAGALPQLFNYLLLPLYVRYLSPAEYGILGYVNAFAWFINITNTLSINSYYMRKYYESDDKRKFTGSIFYFLLIINSSFIIIEGIGLYFLFKWFNLSVNFYPYMLLALVEVFFASISIIPLRYYRLESLLGKYLGFNVGLLVLKHGLAILLIVGLHFSAEGFLLGGAVSAGVMAVYLIITAAGFAKTVVNMPIVKNALRFSLPLLPGAYASVALMMIDRVILEKYVSLSELGIYTLGNSMAVALNVVFNSMLIVIEPRVYKMYTLDTYHSQYQNMMNQYMFSLFTIVAIFVIFIQDVTFWLFPVGYGRAAVVAMIVSVSTIFYGIQNIAGLQFLLHHKVTTQSVVMIIAATANVLLNLFLIPVYGIYGAAAAYLAAYFIGGTLAVIYANKFSSGVVLRKKDYFVAVVFALMIAVSCLMVSGGPWEVWGRFLLVAMFIGFCVIQYSILPGLFNSSAKQAVGEGEGGR